MTTPLNKIVSFITTIFVISLLFSFFCLMSGLVVTPSFRHLLTEIQKFTTSYNTLPSRKNTIPARTDNIVILKANCGRTYPVPTPFRHWMWLNISSCSNVITCACSISYVISVLLMINNLPLQRSHERSQITHAIDKSQTHAGDEWIWFKKRPANK